MLGIFSKPNDSDSNSLGTSPASPAPEPPNARDGSSSGRLAPPPAASDSARARVAFVTSPGTGIPGYLARLAYEFDVEAYEAADVGKCLSYIALNSPSRSIVIDAAALENPVNENALIDFSLASGSKRVILASETLAASDEMLVRLRTLGCVRDIALKSIEADFENHLAALALNPATLDETGSWDLGKDAQLKRARASRSDVNAIRNADAAFGPLGGQPHDRRGDSGRDGADCRRTCPSARAYDETGDSMDSERQQPAGDTADGEEALPQADGGVGGHGEDGAADELELMRLRQPALDELRRALFPGSLGPEATRIFKAIIPRIMLERDAARIPSGPKISTFIAETMLAEQEGRLPSQQEGGGGKDSDGHRKNASSLNIPGSAKADGGNAGQDKAVPPSDTPGPERDAHAGKEGSGTARETTDTASGNSSGPGEAQPELTGSRSSGSRRRRRGKSKRSSQNARPGQNEETPPADAASAPGETGDDATTAPTGAATRPRVDSPRQEMAGGDEDGKETKGGEKNRDSLPLPEPETCEQWAGVYGALLLTHAATDREMQDAIREHALGLAERGEEAGSKRDELHFVSGARRDALRRVRERAAHPDPGKFSAIMRLEQLVDLDVLDEEGSALLEERLEQVRGRRFPKRTGKGEFADFDAQERTWAAELIRRHLSPGEGSVGGTSGGGGGRPA